MTYSHSNGVDHASLKAINRQAIMSNVMPQCTPFGSQPAFAEDQKWLPSFHLATIFILCKCFFFVPCFIKIV
jgi:hypothetical protein